LIQIHNN